MCVLVRFISVVIVATGLCVSVFAADWATADGSCYGKGAKLLGVGVSVLPFGFYGSFDYGFHDAISGGIATGFNTTISSYWWRKNSIPILARAAFHPFNLTVLADKIAIRNKLDPYAGLAAGGSIIFWSFRRSGAEFDTPDANHVFVREYLGVRFYPKENFYVFAEDCAGLGLLNAGVGFKF